VNSGWKGLQADAIHEWRGRTKALCVDDLDVSNFGGEESVAMRQCDCSAEYNASNGELKLASISISPFCFQVCSGRSRLRMPCLCVVGFAIKGKSSSR